MSNITVTVYNIEDGVDTSYTATVDRSEALRAGVARLGAVKVGRSRYYCAEETDEIYRLTEREVISLGAGELDERGVDYSLWCSCTGRLITRPTAAVRKALGR